MDDKFMKKDGTTNLGFKYERLNIVRLTLQLTIDNKINNFKVSSNEQLYGRFDDIICEIEKKRETLKYALQLKYSNSKEKLITIQNFQSEIDNFGILKYLNDFVKNKDIYKGFKLILFTNKKLEHTNDIISVGVDEKKVDLQLERCKPDELYEPFNTNENKDSCYKFNVIKTYTENKTQQQTYDDFFSNFYLYTNQKNVDELKEHIVSNLLKDFYVDDSETKNKRKKTTPNIDLYKTFVKKWNDFEDEKFKLSKEIMMNVLALSLLDPYMKKLNFDNVPVTAKETILKEALSQFDVTVFKPEQEKKVKKMYSDAKSKLALNPKVDVYLKKYRFLFSKMGPVDDISKLNKKDITRLLCLLNECPLIIKKSNIIEKIFHLLGLKKKIIVLAKKSENIPEQVSTVFSNLSKIKKFEIYETIINKFECSIQRKEKILIKELINPCDQLTEIFTPNELIDMANDCFIICDEEEKMSKNYMSRRLSTVDDKTIEESDIFKYEEDNKVNIICADPGMGKTQLMMKLKNDERFSLSWTIMIYVRNHNVHFDINKEGNVKDFKDYIVERLKKRYETEEFNSKFLSYLKEFRFIDIRYIWDGLDEISETHLDTITNIIEKLSNEGSKHWITARNHLKETLENRFHVSSLTILEFDDEEQKQYIDERLGALNNYSTSNMLNNITKILNSYPSKEVLGMPLLIFIVTDVLLRNPSTPVEFCLSDGEFSISKLYKHFIDAKFEFHSEKQNLDKDNTHQNEKHKNSKAKRIENYEKIARALHFDDSFHDGLDSESQKCLENIKKDGDDFVGIIIRVTDKNIPVFLHTSFSEYFAASYLSKNNESIPQDKKQFKNIDVFLESIKSES